jgi:hypothetical protein
MNAFGATLRAGLHGKLDCFADAHIGPAAADVAARVIGSAADLTDIEAETVFDIPGRWKPRSISALIRFWLAGRFKAARNASHSGRMSAFDGRLATFDQTLGVGDRLFVEGSDPHRQRVDETVEFGVMKVLMVHLLASLRLE